MSGTYPPGARRDTRTRVLLAVQEIHATRPTVTIPALCEATGRSRRVVHDNLVELWRDGLVDWRDGANGTIHPTCERIAV